MRSYKGDAQILRALKAGATRLPTEKYVSQGTPRHDPSGSMPGRRRFLPEASYEIAEYATDDALTRAEINVLRLIAAGNANKQIADQLSITEETVRSRPSARFDSCRSRAGRPNLITAHRV
jgi:DNA-binding NarL/FixJ family response regulator